MCLVKLGIKSFRVPELSIEVPETATIGSLKVCFFFHRIFWKSFIYLDNNETLLLFARGQSWKP